MRRIWPWTALCFTSDLIGRRVRQSRRKACRGAEQGARRDSAGSHPFALLLGQLGRPAYPRCRRWQRSCRCFIRPASALSASNSPILATSTNTQRSAVHSLPAHMVLLPGVIDTTTNIVEHPEVVARRICRSGSRGRRPRTGHRQRGLRLRHLHRAGVGYRARSVVEAESHARGGRSRIVSPVGPQCSVLK